MRRTRYLVEDNHQHLLLDKMSFLEIVILFLTDGSIEGPPSFKPAKKYSDLSGLEVSCIDRVRGCVCEYHCVCVCVCVHVSVGAWVCM